MQLGWPKIIAFSVALGIWVVGLNMDSKSPWDMWLMALATTIFCLPFLWMAFKFFNFIQAGEKLRDEDISHEKPHPTPFIAEIVEHLNTLGFVRLGEIRTPLARRTTTISWVFVSPDHSTIAEVVSLNRGKTNFIEFNTAFADNAFLQTTFPIGEDTDFPQLRTRYSRVSVLEAYQQHLKERSNMERAHGSAHSIGSISECLKWNAYFREHYLRTRFQRSLLIWRIVTLYSLGLIGFVVFTAAIPDESRGDAHLVMMVVISAAILILTAVICLILFYFPNQIKTAMRRVSKT